MRACCISFLRQALHKELGPFLTLKKIKALKKYQVTCIAKMIWDPGKRERVQSMSVWLFTADTDSYICVGNYN